MFYQALLPSLLLVSFSFQSFLHFFFPSLLPRFRPSQYNFSHILPFIIYYFSSFSSICVSTHFFYWSLYLVSSVWGLLSPQQSPARPHRLRKKLSTSSFSLEMPPRISIISVARDGANVPAAPAARVQVSSKLSRLFDWEIDR